LRESKKLAVSYQPSAFSNGPAGNGGVFFLAITWEGHDFSQDYSLDKRSAGGSVDEVVEAVLGLGEGTILLGSEIIGARRRWIRQGIRR
jgi:hypothetical protein